MSAVQSVAPWWRVVAGLASLWVAPASGQGTPAIRSSSLSVAGTRLNMDQTQVLQSLQGQLRIGAKVEQVSSSPMIVNVEAGSGSCGWGQAAGSPCTGYRAILFRDREGRNRTVSIVLDQYFDSPVPIAEVDAQLRRAYGQPDVVIPPRVVDFARMQVKSTAKWSDGADVEQPGYFPWTLWIWSPDLSRVPKEARLRLFDLGPNTGDVGLRAPLLRVILNSSAAMVKGMRVVLSDPDGFVRLDELRPSPSQKPRAIILE